MIINIDDTAGFCWGVVRTVEIVEAILREMKNENVFVLGQIIHNPREIERLENIGLKTISRDDFPKIASSKPKVIIRAHGEPPETYQIAQELGIELIDATCPLVKRLQRRIKEKFLQDYQIVIYGKKEHAEVIGLRGVCNDECIVIRNVEEALANVDFNRKTILFSQTTMDKHSFQDIKEALEKRLKSFAYAGNIEEYFLAKDTICHYVSDREEKLTGFATANNVVIFVAGRNSSNGKSLYNVCKSANNNTYFIEDVGEIDFSWLSGAEKIGITGATSTPQWYLKLVKNTIEKKLNRKAAKVQSR